MADRFVPEVMDIEKEESGVVGYFHIKFTLVDPCDPANRSYPVNYYGGDLDFSNDEVKAELWKKYGYQFAQEAGE
jgi:hypothetical protein